MDDPFLSDDDLDAPPRPGPAALSLTVAPDQAGLRLDRVLAEAAVARPGLSRSRVTALILAGHLADGAGVVLADPSRKVKPGEQYVLTPPAPQPALPRPQAIPLTIVYEDADLIVIDKPAGMVVHPAPGAEDGTLVNALLHHCGPTLTGIGGSLRPGIVHRIDKDTSGLLVAAKTAVAQEGLARLFASHDIERRYVALCWGLPQGRSPDVVVEAAETLRIDAPIARHPVDRKRMAVVAGGRAAVTRMRVTETFGQGRSPTASLIECRLETGRTHQIRVHAAHIGSPLVGDPVYGQARAIPPGALEPAARGALLTFARQALHAASLGFRHPQTGAMMRFEADLPADFAVMVTKLRRNGDQSR